MVIDEQQKKKLNTLCINTYHMLEFCSQCYRY